MSEAASANLGDILARWYAALKAGDLETFAQVAAPDIVLRWNGPGDLVPWAGEHRGISAALAFFAKVGAALEIVSVTPVDQLFAANRALLVLDGHWRLRASGEELRVRAANLFTFRDSMVVGYEVFPDSAAFARALARAA